MQKETQKTSLTRPLPGWGALDWLLGRVAVGWLAGFASADLSFEYSLAELESDLAYGRDE